MVSFVGIHCHRWDFAIFDRQSDQILARSVMTIHSAEFHCFQRRKDNFAWFWKPATSSAFLEVPYRGPLKPKVVARHPAYVESSREFVKKLRQSPLRFSTNPRFYAENITPTNSQCKPESRLDNRSLRIQILLDQVGIRF